MQEGRKAKISSTSAPWKLDSLISLPQLFVPSSWPRRESHVSNLYVEFREEGREPRAWALTLLSSGQPTVAGGPEQWHVGGPLLPPTGTFLRTQSLLPHILGSTKGKETLI